MFYYPERCLITLFYFLIYKVPSPKSISYLWMLLHYAVVNSISFNTKLFEQGNSSQIFHLKLSNLHHHHFINLITNPCSFNATTLKRHSSKRINNKGRKIVLVFIVFDKRTFFLMPNVSPQQDLIHKMHCFQIYLVWKLIFTSLVLVLVGNL